MSVSNREIILIAPEILNNRSMPSVGLASIGAFLAAQGLQVRIVDAQFRKEDPVPVLRQASPTIVGIAVESRTLARALRLARLAKQLGHTVVVGGVHVSLVRQRMLEYPEVDYAIRGDGEVPMFELIKALEEKNDLSSVSGLIFRGPDGAAIENQQRSPVLDELPAPDYRLAGVQRIDLYPLVTSRDCPYSCTFCTTGALSHGSFRPRSAEAAVAEIELAKERYGTRSFIVVDENFAYNMDRAKRFCELLIGRRVNLPWTAFEGVRTEVVNPEFLRLLRASGCRWIFFGIETVENAVLKSIRKANKFQHLERANRLAHEYGIKTGGFLIIGLPDSTFERDMIAADWALRNLDKCTFWTAIPYYGTALYTWVKKNGTLLREPVGENLINTQSTMPFFETPDYLARERKRAHVAANLRSGMRYFIDYLDFESRAKIPSGKRTDDYIQRRLVQLAWRYDRSFLPQLVRDRCFPDYLDPLVAARRMQQEAADALPADLHGAMGSPAEIQAEPFRILRAAL